MKFGHRVADYAAPDQPNKYIKDVISEFNNGTQNFDAVPSDQGQAPLELMPQVNGQNVYNFALARVRMRTQVPVNNVRLFFRLFTTAVSNLTFDPVNYPTSVGPNFVSLLGRTSPTPEIVSIPFFAEPRVETRTGEPAAASMTTQTDPANVLSFAVTPPGGETVRFAAAYLDINSDTRRYPAAPNGDGPFVAADCVSIRNIIRGQHQCMVAEIFYGDPAVPGSGDQTEPGATPATSDNLAQRNLLIIESANPGHPATRMVQHSFDIVLPNRRDRIKGREELRLQTLALERARHGRNDGPAGFVALAAAPVRADAASSEMAASLARAPLGATYDELLFFWNNLPRDSRVEVHLPSLDVDYILLMRQLRRAPQTLRFVDEHTLSLIPDGVTYLPIPNLGPERVAGLLTVTLPDGIKAGQVYTVDVLQMRLPVGVILGAFRLTIPVSKAMRLYAREARLLTVFEERLKLTSVGSRWYPILIKQVEYFRARAQQMAEEAADECAQATGDGKGVRLRIIVEQIKVLDFYGPLVHGSGSASLIAHVTSPNAGGVGTSTRLPSTGDYPVSDRPEGYVIDVGKEIFRGTVVDALTVELWSAEPAEDKRTCHYRRVFKGKAESWLGHYKPSDERRDPENVGDWQVWYRIEAV